MACEAPCDLGMVTWRLTLFRMGSSELLSLKREAAELKLALLYVSQYPILSYRSHSSKLIIYQQLFRKLVLNCGRPTEAPRRGRNVMFGIVVQLLSTESFRSLL
jgi:hypothetical protein